MVIQAGSDEALQGKVVVVTGAGRGIGKAIAIAYAKAGANVVGAARTAAELEATVAEISAAGGKARSVITDVSQPDSVDRLFHTVEENFGALDILVANAGGNFDPNPVESSNEAAWVQTIEVNLLGVYYCAKRAVPLLKKPGTGKIITVGSGLGHHGRAGSSAYACSKAGLWMLTRVLAQELWQYNISVNELVPGPVNTAINSGFGGNARFGESEWFKEPGDVVPLALFLASQPDIGPTAQSFSLLRRDN